MDGHVVGIVTAILNPSDQRTFIGIGFAVPIENAAGRGACRRSDHPPPSGPKAPPAFHHLRLR
jgi:S1-C subfamily serine protease